jgi:undecaprenyl-diphosphatase
MDAAAFHWVIAHRWAPLSPLMIFLSHGGAWAWVAATAALGVSFRLCFRRAGALAGAYQSSMAIGLATLLADALAKPFLDRARPYATFTDIAVLAGLQKSASFPSTHAAAAFAGAYGLARVFPELRIPIWLVAFLVAYSRVYVGVHYPLDVIGGALVGLAAACFVVDGTRWYSDQLAARHSKRPSGPAVPRTDVAR